MGFAAIKDEEPEKELDSDQSFNFTINKSAAILGIDRRTLKKRVLTAECKPKEKTTNGYLKYSLADVSRAAFSNEKIKRGYVVEDLLPKELAEHFMARKRELEVLQQESELLIYDEAAVKFAELGQQFSKFFDTFIDDLEQTQLFTVEQLEQMQNLCDEQRIVFAEAEF